MTEQSKKPNQLRQIVVLMLGLLIVAIIGFYSGYEQGKPTGYNDCINEAEELFEHWANDNGLVFDEELDKWVCGK